MSTNFETAENSDFNEILYLINKINREWYSTIIPEEHFQDPFLSRKQLDHMTTFMDFFVLRESGKIIAVGSLGSRDANTAWIPLMNVHSKYQRMGIGSSLMEFLEKLAKSRKFTKIHLETDSKAEWAINFYKKHEFSIFKRDKNPWGYHVWLEKSLK